MATLSDYFGNLTRRERYLLLLGLFVALLPFSFWQSSQSVSVTLMFGAVLPLLPFYLVIFLTNVIVMIIALRQNRKTLPSTIFLFISISAVVLTTVIRSFITSRS